MPEFAVLVAPNANRVYREAAPALAAAELAVVGEHRLSQAPGDVRVERVGGVDYVVFAAAAPLTDPDVRVLSDLSTSFALFEREAGRLRPIEVAPSDRYDDDLVTIPRYPGKTNEGFTKLLVNLATAVSTSAAERADGGDPVRLIDPLAGRGTTLHQAMLFGDDVTGVEIDRRDHEANATFLEQWLKDKRLKHKVEKETHRRGREKAAHVVRITIGERERPQRVQLVHDDTANLAAHLAAGSFDVLVADLPYGIQHGPHGGGGVVDLLRRALPAWRSVLRGGAGVALAYNTKGASREDVEDVIEQHLSLDVGAAQHDFVHRVDRTITRDVVIATRK